MVSGINFEPASAIYVAEHDMFPNFARRESSEVRGRPEGYEDTKDTKNQSNSDFSKSWKVED